MSKTNAFRYCLKLESRPYVEIKEFTEMTCLEISDSTISCFRSYLTNRYICVSVGKELSTLGKLIRGVLQGSILGPLLFLLYVNDMLMAVNCELLLYGDDTCLLFMGKDTKEIEDN